MAVRFFHNSSAFQWLSKLVWNPYIMAVREGLTLTLPIILAGTAAILLNSFPLEGYQNYMLSFFGPQWKLFGGYIHNGTLGVLSVIMALSISHSLAEDYNTKYPMDRIMPSIVSFVTFSSLICTMEPLEGGTLSLRWLGVHGLLLAIVTSLLACSLLRLLLRVSWLRLTFYSGSGGLSVSHAMNALFPSILTIMAFAGLKTITKMYGISSPNSAIYQILYEPFHSLGGNYLETATIYGFARHVLWFLGVHGSNVLEPIMQELYLPAIQANIENYRNGLPTLIIFTKPFFDCYTSMGGAGSTLGLLIACILFHKDNGAKKVAYISIIPSIFNINELLLFGLPVVLNPVFFIPFITVPLISTVVSYYACAWGIVPMTVSEVSWNVPILINAFIATDSLGGSLLQIANLVIATTVYAPFVVLDNKLKMQQFSANFDKLVSVAIEGVSADAGPKLLACPHPVGGLARNLATDLKGAVKRGEIYLEYQPQVNSDTGRVYGVESLVRWRHPHIGAIPPPVLIGLAEDSAYIRFLGIWVFEAAVRQMSEWQARGVKDFVMSVNISARQLEDPGLPDTIIRILNHYAVPVQSIKLELTESIALTSQMVKNEVLARLHAMNIQLAIDDFGMGHSSLLYLKKFPVSSLKIDAVLSKDVLISRSSCEIILSLADLCRSLSINIVAEFVDNEPQLLLLRSLGCSNIQGYFYSPPLESERAFDFITKTHKAYGTDLLKNTDQCQGTG